MLPGKKHELTDSIPATDLRSVWNWADDAFVVSRWTAAPLDCHRAAFMVERNGRSMMEVWTKENMTMRNLTSDGSLVNVAFETEGKPIVSLETPFTAPSRIHMPSQKKPMGDSSPEDYMPVECLLSTGGNSVSWVSLGEKTEMKSYTDRHRPRNKFLGGCIETERSAGQIAVVGGTLDIQVLDFRSAKPLSQASALLSKEVPLFDLKMPSYFAPRGQLLGINLQGVLQLWDLRRIQTPVIEWTAAIPRRSNSASSQPYFLGHSESRQGVFHLICADGSMSSLRVHLKGHIVDVIASTDDEVTSKSRVLAFDEPTETLLVAEVSDSKAVSVQTRRVDPIRMSDGGHKDNIVEPENKVDFYDRIVMMA